MKLKLSIFLFKINRRIVDFFNLHILSYFKWRGLLNKSQVFLEFGSGAKKGINGWVTVDLRGADISYDLSKGVPLPDNSVDVIYSSHMFEHIPYADLIVFIDECYRVLKDKGELSVCVPNAKLYIESYIKGESCIHYESAYKPAMVDTDSMRDQVNYIAYMGGHHHYMFDEINLLHTLKKSSFASVTLRSFDEKIDLKSRDFESIYAL